MAGFVKLHRKFLDWEWYDDVPTKVLFLHLLLEAKWKRGPWKSNFLERGQLSTGRRKLASETGLSERQVRTALKKLEIAQQVTIKTTRHYSIITVTNFDLYQGDDQQVTNKRPAKSPTSDQLSDHNLKKIRKEEDKKKKKETKKKVGTFVPSFEFFKNYFQYEFEARYATEKAIEWIAYRKEQRFKAWTEATWKKNLKSFTSEEDWAEALDQSMRNQYQGVFEVKKKPEILTPLRKEELEGKWD